MAATLRKDKRSGKYIVSVHKDGKRQQESFAHKRKAEAAVNRYNRLLASGSFTIKTNEAGYRDSLNFYIQCWYDQMVLGGGDPDAMLAPGTRDRYLSVWNTKLKNDIGKRAMADLTTAALYDYATKLKNKGHTRSDISLRFSIITGAMGQARLRDVIPANYGKGLLSSVYPKRVAKRDAKQISPFADQEVELILSNTRPQDYPVFMLLFTTGCRLGELLGLNWDSVNFNEGYLVIQRSFRAGVLSDHTKTGNDRIIPVSEDILDVLRQLKVKNAKLRLKGVDTDAVFVQHGSRLCQNSFRNAWKRTLRKTGLEYRKVHTIRHTVASRLLNEGHPVKLVAEILGHTVQTLLTTYSHILESDEDKKRQMLRGMQNAVKRGQEKSPDFHEENQGFTNMVPKARFELARPWATTPSR